MSGYSGSIAMENDMMFKFQPGEVRRKMKKNTLQSHMNDYILDEKVLRADAIFDDDNSKDLGRRSMAFQQNGIMSDKGIFGMADQSFKLNKIDHQKFYKKYTSDSGCCGGSFGNGGCCESNNTEKNLL